MPKERTINPAQAQRKADKAKAIKKGKAETLNRNREKLARKNPDRLQKQLDELKAIETSGGSLTAHEKRVVEELTRDIAAVRKAREALGDKAPSFARGGGAAGKGGRDNAGGRGGGVLGKRRRDGEASDESDESDVPEDVKSIPMPGDTPPPIPKEVLDRWYQKRRERYGHGDRDRQGQQHGRGGGGGGGTNANDTPLGENARGWRPPRGDTIAASSTSVPPKVEVKTVYESAPVVRDLKKEAMAFVPAAVRVKLDKVKGKGGLVEPEEADRLEREGYLGRGKMAESGDVEMRDPRGVTMEEVEDDE